VNVNKWMLDKMIGLRSFYALRLSSNFNIGRTVQCCGFKSRYNVENLYPNSTSDLSAKVRHCRPGLA